MSKRFEGIPPTPPESEPQKSGGEAAEQALSVEVALKKLEKVNDPNLKKFGIRFVSKAEYESIMQTHDLADREIYFIDFDTYEGVHEIHEIYEGGDSKNLKGYLDQTKTEDPYTNIWYSRIFEQAKWEESGITQNSYHKLLRGLRYSHEKITRKVELPDDLEKWEKDEVEKRLSNIEDKDVRSGLESFIKEEVHKEIEEKVHLENLKRESKPIRDKVYADFRDSLIYKSSDYSDPYFGLASYAIINAEKIDEGTDDLSREFIKEFGEEEFEKFKNNPRSYYWHMPSFDSKGWDYSKGEQMKALVVRLSNLKELLEKLPKEDFEVMKKFYVDSDFSKDNVRDFIRAYSINAPLFSKHSEGKERQYEVALIFDQDALYHSHGINKGRQELGGYWDRIYSQEEEDYKPADHLLGAVVIIPDKKAVRDFVDIDKNGGEWAHPIFNRNGIVQFPRT